MEDHRCEADPLYATTMHLNNFLLRMPGGAFHDSKTYGASGEDRKRTLRQLGFATISDEYSERHLDQTVDQFFATIARVVGEIADIDRVRQLVDECKDIGEPEPELSRILIETYRRLRALGYNHFDLTV